MKERDEEMVEEKREGGSIGALLKGIVIGGMVGAGIALLSAPRPGQETRDLLVEKGIELKDKAQTTVDMTRSRAEDLVEKGTQQVSSVRQQSNSLLTEQKANLQGAVEGLREGVRTYVDLNQEKPQGTDEAGSV